MDPYDQSLFQDQRSDRPFVTPFGLIPLTVPYEDSPPEARVLNAVVAGLVFEGRPDIALGLGMPKTDFVRVLRSLRNDGAIYVGANGRYRLSFRTSNFPNIVAK